MNQNDQFLFGEEWIRKLLNDVPPTAIGWQPRPSDISWTANLIRSMSDGGRWTIPMNQSVWAIDKTNKVFRCVVGPKDDMFDKLTKVCARLGYKVEYAPESVAPAVIGAEDYGKGKTASRLENPGVM